jgi:hypothetical protein
MLSTSLFPPLLLLVLQQGILDPEGAVSQLPLIFPGNSREKSGNTSWCFQGISAYIKQLPRPDGTLCHIVPIFFIH